jgi:hypothetical protein
VQRPKGKPMVWSELDTTAAPVGPPGQDAVAMTPFAEVTAAARSVAAATMLG